MKPEIEEEEVVVMSKAKKPKAEAVRSAPPKKKDDKKDNEAASKPVESLKLDEKDKSKSKSKDKKSNSSNSDKYSDDDGWNMHDDDLFLEDKPKKEDKIESNPQQIDFFGTDINNDPILDLDNQNKDGDGSPEDLFQNEFDDLENEFNNMQMGGNEMVQKRGNPFGQSITKELLQQSKKEIENELNDFDDDQELNLEKELDAKNALKKPNIAIEIDENADIN